MKKLLKEEAGQTVVEYMLLFSVAVSLAVTFYKSNTFQRLFGEKGEVGKMVKSQNEFSYRHGFAVSGNGGKVSDVDKYNREGSDHPSYKGDPTRFFGPSDPYGN